MPEQRLVFDVLFQTETGQPIGAIRFDDAQAGTFEKFDEISEGALCEGATAVVRYEMRVSTTVHAFIGRHSQTSYLEQITKFLEYF